MAALVVLFWRFTSAAAASWLYLLVSGRRRAALRHLPWRRVGVLLLLGALYVGNSYTYIASLEVVPISLSSIITYLYPAIVAVMALRFVRRLPGRRAWVALGHLPARGDAGPGRHPGGRRAAALGPRAGLRQPGHLCRLDRPPGAPRGRPAGWRCRESAPSVVVDEPDRTTLGLPPGDAEAAIDAPDPAAAAALMTTATAAVYAVLTLA